MALSTANSGTGFIIGPHYILTAAHVVGFATNLTKTFVPATNLVVRPGTSLANSGVAITDGKVMANPNWYLDIPPPTRKDRWSESPSQSQNDYAVIYTPTDLTQYGIFDLSNFFRGA